MLELTYRLATTDDIDTMIHHRCSMFADIGSGTEDTRAQMNADFRIWALDHLANGTFWTWFACDGDKVVCGAGILAMDVAPSPLPQSLPLAYIYNVYTEKEYRRQGIARQLMQHVLADLNERGFRTVGLHASEFGRKLYEELGFVATNEMRLDLSTT